MSILRMMSRSCPVAAGLLLGACLVASSPGQASPAPPADPTAGIPRQLKINIAWQIALEASDFSPGIIDGVFGRKGKMALSEYAADNFPGIDQFDPRVFVALKVDVDGALALYTITPDDAAQVGGPIPANWNEKARLQRLNYESLADCLSEKFHCTRGLLQTLNPGVSLDRLAPGQRLVVPNIRPFPVDNRVVVTRREGAASCVVNLAEKTIRLYNASNRQIALFHCSVARDKAKLPRRDSRVVAIAAPYPTYQFRPEMWPEVTNVTRPLIINPGPRNPVGLAWVSLDLSGYGIHGTPTPEMIGKTGSHGCFRMTNWDALKFAGWVREAMIVNMINPES